MTYKRGCIVCGWFTLSSPVPDPVCPDCGWHVARGPKNPASPEEIARAQEALERFRKEGFREFQESSVIVEKINTTWTPEGVIELEAEMSMEKRAVVNTEKEKTAHEEVKQDLTQPGTTSGRTQTQKPNEAAKPRSEEK